MHAAPCRANDQDSHATASGKAWRLLRKSVSSVHWLCSSERGHLPVNRRVPSLPLCPPVPNRAALAGRGDALPLHLTMLFQLVWFGTRADGAVEGAWGSSLHAVVSATFLCDEYTMHDRAEQSDGCWVVVFGSASAMQVWDTSPGAHDHVQGVPSGPCGSTLH